MGFQFEEIKKVDPWDKFIAEMKPLPDMKPAAAAKAYHEWLEKQNPEVGTCILCERRFKPRTKEKP